MKNYFLIAIFAIVILSIIILAVWQKQSEFQQHSSDTKLRVVASFYPLAEFAKQVGGDLVSVTNLTPAGSEPHDFDPSPRDIATLQHSNVFIYNGAGLEPWVPHVLPDLQNNNVAIVNVTATDIPLIPNDPHVWLDPLAAIIEVQKIAKAFSEADPQYAAQYMQRATAYIAALQTLNTEFAQGLRMCKRREVVTSHAVFAYMGRQYTFTMIPIAGISPDEEPSPARLAEVATLVRARGIRHILFETLVSPALSETIAKETGATTLSFNPLEGLTEQEIAVGKNYISVQRENLVAIRTALDCI